MTEKYIPLHNESIILKCEEVGLLLTNINFVEVKSKGILKPTYNFIRYPISDIKVQNGKVQVEIEENWIYLHFKNGTKSFELYNDKEAHQWANEISKLVTGADLEPMPIDKAEIFASAVAESKDTGKAMGEAVLGVIPIPGTRFIGRTVGGLVGGVVGGSVKGISEIMKSGKQPAATTVETTSQSQNSASEAFSTPDNEMAEEVSSQNSDKNPNRCHSCGAPIAPATGQSVRCQYCDSELF